MSLGREFDGLPLGVPTKIADNGDVEQWATRVSDTHGDIEHRAKAGGPTDLARKRDARLAAAIATLRQWAADARNAAPVTAGNSVARVQVINDRAGVLFDNMADLLESLGRA